MQLSTFNSTPPNAAPGASARTLTGVWRSQMQFAKSGFEEAALGAAWNECRWFPCCNASRRCVQHGTELIRVVGLDDAQQPVAEAERCDNGFRRLNKPPQAEKIVTGFCRVSTRCRLRRKRTAQQSPRVQPA